MTDHEPTAHEPTCGRCGRPLTQRPPNASIPGTIAVILHSDILPDLRIHRECVYDREWDGNVGARQRGEVFIEDIPDEVQS